MPRIPVYESQVSVPQVGPGFLSGVAQQAGQGPAMVNQAMQGLSRGLAQASDILQERQDKDEALKALNELSAFQIAQSQKARDRQQNAQPGAPGYVDETLKDYDDDAKALLGKYAHNRRAQELLDQRLSSYRASVGDAAVGFYASAVAKQQKTQLAGTLDNLQKQIFADPRQFEAAKSTWDASIDNSSLSPIDKADVIKSGRRALASSYWQGEVERRPGFVVQQMMSKTGFPGSDDLDFDQRAGIARAARAEQRHREAEGRRVQNETWQTNYAQARINARDGLLTREDVDASVNAKLLPPAARDDLYALVDRSMLAGQQRAAQIEIVQNSLATGAPLDPKNKDHKKAVDATFDTMWPSVSTMLASPETRARGIQVITDFAGKTTVLPERVESQIRADLRSPDPARVASAAELTDRIASVNPRLLDGFDKKDVDLAVVANQNIRAGVDQKRAVDMAQTKVNAADDPEIERRKAWVASEAGKDAIAKRVDGDLADLSRGVFGRVLNWNFNATELPDGLKAEYQNLAEQNYLRTGDADSARALAKQDIMKVWGRTEIGGDRWMKYAPENFYKVGADDDGGWIKKQLIREVKEKHAFDEKTFNADKQIRLAVTPEGARARDANGNPAPFYVVQIVDGGVLKELRDAKTGTLVYWRPDWKSSDEYNALVDKARKRSEELKQEGDDAVLRAQQRRQDNLSRDPMTGLPKGVKKKGLGDFMQELQPPPGLSLNPRSIDGLE